MTPKDDLNLAAACLVAAEIVTADRIEKAGGKVKRPKTGPRITLWRKVIKAIESLDPYDEDSVRGGGGVELKWTIWAYNAKVAASKDPRNECSSFDWDMAYEVTLKGYCVDVHAFGEECSDLGRGFYEIRSEYKPEKPLYPGLGVPRGDTETPHIEAHRKALALVLKEAGLDLDE